METDTLVNMTAGCWLDGCGSSTDRDSLQAGSQAQPVGTEGRFLKGKVGVTWNWLLISS
jgi:hypothetical protein